MCVSRYVFVSEVQHCGAENMEVKFAFRENPSRYT